MEQHAAEAEKARGLAPDAQRVAVGLLGGGVLVLSTALAILLSIPSAEAQQDDAIDIRSVEELMLIGRHSDYSLDKVYRQQAHLNLEGIEWTPIGTAAAPFKGTYDGNHFLISNLSVGASGEGVAGLFGVVAEGGLVLNAGLYEPEVRGGAGGVAVGPLAGELFGRVQASFAYGGVVSGERNGGGLVGVAHRRSDGAPSIEASYSSAVVRIEGSATRHGSGTVHFGGLSGAGDGGIRASYFLGGVEFAGTESANAVRFGGLTAGPFSGTIAEADLQYNYSTVEIERENLAVPLSVTGTEIAGLVAASALSTDSGQQTSVGTDTAVISLEALRTLSDFADPGQEHLNRLFSGWGSADCPNTEAPQPVWDLGTAEDLPRISCINTSTEFLFRGAGFTEIATRAPEGERVELLEISRREGSSGRPFAASVTSEGGGELILEGLDNGRLEIGEGETFTVLFGTAVDDNIREDSETYRYRVDFSGVDLVQPGVGSVEEQIREFYFEVPANDELVLGFAPQSRSVTANEADGQFELTVLSLNGALDVERATPFALEAMSAGGVPLGHARFIDLSGGFALPAGAESGTVTVNLVDNRTNQHGGATEWELRMVRAAGLASGTDEEVTAALRIIDDDPPSIEIATAEELARIGVAADYPLDGTYVQTAHISLAGAGNWRPIAPLATAPFTGVYDGNDHTVRGLTVDYDSASEDGSGAGLFGVVGSGGVIRNLGVYDAHVTGTYNAGGLAGLLQGTARVETSYVNSAVVSVREAGRNAGGLVGATAMESGTVSVNASYASGVRVLGHENLGGLVGHLRTEVANSHAGGEVGEVIDGFPLARERNWGGLFGGSQNEHVRVRNSYSTVEVAELALSDVGALGSNLRPLTGAGRIVNSWQAVSPGLARYIARSDLLAADTADSSFATWTDRCPGAPAEAVWDFGTPQDLPRIGCFPNLPQYAFAASAAMRGEGDAAPIALAVELANGVAATADVVLNLALEDPAAFGADVTISTPTITLPPGTQRAEFMVRVTDDLLQEGVEVIAFTLGSEAPAAARAAGRFTLTVIDDDVPEYGFAVSELSRNEGDTAEFALEVEITNGVVPLGGAVLALALEDPAAFGADVLISTPTITLAQGAAGGAFTVRVRDDADQEPNRVIAFVLSSPSAAIGAAGRLELTVIDDDNPVFEFDVASVRRGEGDGATAGDLRLLVRETNGARSGMDIELRLTLEDPARFGADVEIRAETVTAQSGRSEAEFLVHVVDDLLQEDDEVIAFTLSSDSAVIGARDRLELTVVDDDVPEYGFTASAASRSEADTAEFALEVALTNGVTPSADAVLNLALADAAAFGADVAISTPAITLPPGTQRAEFMVRVAEDLLQEVDEVIEFTLSSGTPLAAVGAAGRFALTVADNDVPEYEFAVSELRRAESDASEIELAAEVTNGVTPLGMQTLRLAVEDTVAFGMDVRIPNPDAIASAALPRAVFRFTVADDRLFEGDETLGLLLVPLDGNVSRVGGRSRVELTIVDDDVPVFQLTDQSRTFEEETVALRLLVSLEDGVELAADVVLNLELEERERFDLDVEFITETVTLRPGDTGGQFTAFLVDDSLEEDEEVLVFTLVSPDTRRAQVDPSNSQLTITVLDNDIPEYGFAASELRRSEGEAAEFALGVEVTNGVTPLRDAVLGLSLADAAAFGDDVEIATSAITLAGGAAQGAFMVRVEDDLLQEGEEAIEFMLVSESATIGAASRFVLTVADDDVPEYGFTGSSAARGEGDEFEVEVGVTNGVAPSSGAVLTLLLADGARFGDDVEIATSTITLAFGAARGAFTVSVVDDLLQEGVEVIAFTLSSESATIGAASRFELTVAASDEPPEVVTPVLPGPPSQPRPPQPRAAASSLAAPAERFVILPAGVRLVEGESATFRVMRDQPVSFAEFNFNVALGELEGASSADLTMPDRVTLPQGEMSVEFSVTALKDGVDEMPEKLYLVLSGSGGGADAAFSQPGASVAIQNLPVERYSLAGSVSALDEGGRGVFTIRRGEGAGAGPMPFRVVTSGGEQCRGQLQHVETVMLPAQYELIQFFVRARHDGIDEGLVRCGVRLEGMQERRIDLVVDYEPADLAVVSIPLPSTGGAELGWAWGAVLALAGVLLLAAPALLLRRRRR